MSAGPDSGHLSACLASGHDVNTVCLKNIVCQLFKRRFVTERGSQLDGNRAAEPGTGLIGTTRKDQKGEIMLATLRVIAHDLLSLASIGASCAINIFSPNQRMLRTEISGWDGKPALIVGNGPSAGTDLGAIDYGPFGVRVGVNFFAATDWFERLRPNRYFLQDDYWFEESSDELREKAQRTFDCLNEKVTWGLTLTVPLRYLGSFIQSGRITNSNISIEAMSVGTQRAGDVTHFAYRARFLKELIFWLWSAGLLALPATNIVSSSLFVLLSEGHKKIDVIGLDMTMANDFALNQQGKLGFFPTHFYGKSSTSEPSKGTERKSVALAYEWLAKKFRVFDLLASYASYQKAIVTNRSSLTLLDSFPWRPTTGRLDQPPKKPPSS